jgi:N-acetyl-gamma-glutamyl-phosphate reductase
MGLVRDRLRLKDATHIIANIAIPSTIRLVAETRDGVLEAAEPFARIYPPGRVPDLPAVAHTNFCDIGVSFDPKTGRAVVVAAIDNLVKGAAGQAVQNMNLMLGYPEAESLL